MKKLIFIIVFLSLISCEQSKSPLNTKEEFFDPEKIDNLKIKQLDLPDGFVLYQERIAKLRASLINEQIYQFWQWDSTKQGLVLIEETINKYDRPVGASVFQTWYRGEQKGEKDKIEIDIIICTSLEEMEKTISDYTSKIYSIPFLITETPFAGERSWMPSSQGEESFSVMFARVNVFIRLHVNLQDKNQNELQQCSKELAEKLDNKIFFR